MKNIEELDKKQKIDRWKNRRRMAWLSFGGAILLTVYCFVFLENPADFMIFYQTAMAFCGAIVGAYIGFATYEDVNINRYPYKENNK